METVLLNWIKDLAQHPASSSGQLDISESQPTQADYGRHAFNYYKHPHYIF